MNAPSSCPPHRLTALVLGAALLAFMPTLGGGFLADDFVYVARFRELPWADWPGLFLREWSGGVWGQPLRELRPFAALSLMADARAFGADPLGYRVTTAEMTSDEKDAISHRGQAMRALAPVLVDLLAD